MTNAAGSELGPTALRFRDVARARRLFGRLVELGEQLDSKPVRVMHVCGSHEQAIARFGLRTGLPAAIDLIMGPGCPVCVTDAPEVDLAVALARAGVRVATYGDMLRVPGSSASLAHARAEGARVDTVYSVTEAAELARLSAEPLVFFATGFETTAVATAAVLLDNPPENFYVLSAHKYVPPAMEVVACMPGSRVEGFLAAGHAATITGAEVFEPIARRHQVPIVIAGFEPLDILSALVQLLELVARREPRVVNAFPRCVAQSGNRRALETLFAVFELAPGQWRGIARVSGGALKLRGRFAAHDALQCFPELRRSIDALAPASAAADCRCGDIMAGLASPSDCALFGGECRPDAPVGACMVSSEGTCRIWHAYGGKPSVAGRAPEFASRGNQ